MSELRERLDVAPCAIRFAILTAIAAATLLQLNMRFGYSTSPICALGWS